MKINKSYYALKDQFGDLFQYEGEVLHTETTEELNKEMEFINYDYLDGLLIKRNLKITKIKIIEDND